MAGSCHRGRSRADKDNAKLTAGFTNGGKKVAVLGGPSAKGSITRVSRINVNRGDGIGTRGDGELVDEVASPAGRMALVHSAGETPFGNFEGVVKEAKLVVFSREPILVCMFENIVERKHSGECNPGRDSATVANILGAESTIKVLVSQATKTRDARLLQGQLGSQAVIDQRVNEAADIGPVDL